MATKKPTSIAPINGATQIQCRLPVAPTALAEIGVDPGTWKVLVESIFPSAKTAEGVGLAVRYCQARGLDVMKRPVHVVPMWSTTLGREVETVWPGIAEVQTTAARTGLWAGMDPPKFGPEKTRTFHGSVWRNRRQEAGQAEVTYPEWAEFTVYRLVNGTRCPFTEVVFWEETYARAGEGNLPNSMWQKRPKGQLLKCAKAAALRAAFPEEAGEYTAEEMAGKVIEADSVPVHAQASVVDAGATFTVAASKPNPESESIPAEDGGIDPAMEAAIEEEVRLRVDKLVERSRAAGAWGRAEEYAQAHFTGAHLTYALAELETAKKAASDPASAAIDEAKAAAKAA
jgi:phage recombination protein Bet